MYHTLPPKQSELYQTRNRLCQMPCLSVPTRVFCVERNPQISYPFTLKLSRRYPGMPLWLTECLLFFAFNLKKENHTLWSVDLKPQICTAKKKIGSCCFLSFGFPSFKGRVANLANTQLNRRICTNRVGSSARLLFILSSSFSTGGGKGGWGRSGRGSLRQRKW